MCDSINSAVESQRADGGAMGTIYKITNTLNGKAYVGKTRQSFKRRITEHKRDSSKGRPGIDAAIAKYGWANFTAEIIEVCPVEMLNEREIYWIKKLGTKVPNGYNITDGGDGGRGHSPSAETRAKLSKALKGRPAHNKGVKPSAETCAKISKHHKEAGIKPPDHTGKKRSPETLARMSIAQKAAWARKKAIENGGDK